MGVTVAEDKIGGAPIVMNGDAPLSSLGARSRDAALSGDVEAERNTIFDNLVKVEGDLSGLVAYSIYKQNKRAWLQDFQKAVGRPPTDAEARSYIIGESTERRLATYRHLAAATLAGQGPEAPSGATRPLAGRSRSAQSYVLWAVGLVVAVALIAAFVLVATNLRAGL